MKWPNNSKFAVFLSHDVDRVKKSWFQALYYFFKQRRLYHLLTLFHKRNAYWNFDIIMDIERKYDIRSTFFFLNESLQFDLFKPYQWKLSLGRYKIQDKQIRDIILKLDKEGWEIGVHGSYKSYANSEMLAREKKDLELILGKKIDGIRQHYLNLVIPETWRLQKEAGFQYDASFGFADQIGFRDEKYHPFFPFNDNFLVLPLAIMDSCLLSKENPWEACRELINLAEARKGLLSIVWHNKVFYDSEFPGYATIYEQIIMECKKRNAWFACGSDIVNLISEMGWEKCTDQQK
ncbi:polysaccharide deacetylase family protein [Candidatus Omnitrophota bacterium]